MYSIYKQNTLYDMRRNRTRFRFWGTIDPESEGFKKHRNKGFKVIMKRH